jgi:hypothetical protein
MSPREREVLAKRRKEFSDASKIQQHGSGSKETTGNVMKLSKEELSRMNESAILYEFLAEYARKNLNMKTGSNLLNASGVSRPTFAKALEGGTHIGIEAMLRIQKICGSTLLDDWIEAKRDNQ